MNTCNKCGKNAEDSCVQLALCEQWLMCGLGFPDMSIMSH